MQDGQGRAENYSRSDSSPAFYKLIFISIFPSVFTSLALLKSHRKPRLMTEENTSCKAFELRATYGSSFPLHRIKSDSSISTQPHLKQVRGDKEREQRCPPLHLPMCSLDATDKHFPCRRLDLGIYPARQRLRGAHKHQTQPGAYVFQGNPSNSAEELENAQ